MRSSLTAAAIATTMLSPPALADDIDIVRALYAEFLSDPTETKEARYFEYFSPTVVSIPTLRGGEDAQSMLDTIAFLGEVIPDLKWEVEEIIELGDGRFMVRSLLRGTPVSPFLGVAPGRPFEATSFDIVTVRDRRISRIYPLARTAPAPARN